MWVDREKERVRALRYKWKAALQTDQIFFPPLFCGKVFFVNIDC